MENLFPFILIVIISSYLTVIFNKKIEETLPFTNLSIIIVIYFFGLFNHLELGYYFVVSAAILCAGLLAFNYTKIDLHKIFTVGFIFFFIIFALAMFINKYTFANTWDEAAHWLLTVKNMYILDKLSTVPQSNILYRDYPPGSALFHYFWARNLKVFLENSSYISMMVLIGSFLCSTLKNYSFGDWKKLLLIYPILFFTPLTFYSYAYTGLFVEPLLGILFGYTLFIYFSQKLNIFTILTISLTFFVLVITKSTGIIFASLCIIIIVMDMLLIKKNYMWFRFKDNESLSMRLSSLFMLLVPFFANSTWKNNLAQNNIPKTFDLDIKKVWSDLVIHPQQLPSYKLDGIRHFLQSFFNFDASWSAELYINVFRVSYIAWILVFLILAYLVWHLYLKNKSILLLFAALMITNIIYTFSTLVLAMTSFSEGEISRMFAANRYSLAFFLAIYFIVISLLIEHGVNKKWGKQLSYIFIILFLLFNMNNLKLLNPTIRHNPSIDRENRRLLNTSLLSYMEDGNSLLEFYGGTDYLLLDACPIKITIVNEYYKDFDYFVDYHSGFDYVYFASLYSSVETEDWKTKFGYLFLDRDTIYDHALYKVVYDDEGVHLQFITKMND